MPENSRIRTVHAGGEKFLSAKDLMDWVRRAERESRDSKAREVLTEFANKLAMLS